MAKFHHAQRHEDRAKLLYNNYDPAKHYERILMRDGRPMIASEINEMQSIGLARHKRHLPPRFATRTATLCRPGPRLPVDAETGFVYRQRRQDLSGRADLGDLCDARFGKSRSRAPWPLGRALSRQ